MKKSFFLLTINLLLVASAFACKCANLTVREQIDRADIVFTGDVIDSEKIVVADTSMDGHISSHHFIRYRVAVKQVFKGDNKNDTINIRTGSDDCACTFKPGEKYIIYASHKLNGRHPNDYSTNLCSGTTAFDKQLVDDIRKATRAEKEKQGFDNEQEKEVK